MKNRKWYAVGYYGERYLLPPYMAAALEDLLEVKLVKLNREV